VGIVPSGRFNLAAAALVAFACRDYNNDREYRDGKRKHHKKHGGKHGKHSEGHNHYR
jgi:hypothetical protein